MRRLRCLILACIMAGLLVIPASAVEETESSGDVIYILAPDTELLAVAEITDGYGVGTSNINIFGPIASKLPYGTHYVYWRESQYVYKMAYSEELVYEYGEFSADEVTVITYTTTSGYSGQATFDNGTETDFSLDPGDYLVWSDLGDFPILYERGEVDYAQLTCVILASFGLFMLFDRLVSCCRRR